MIFKKQSDILTNMVDRVSVETNKLTDFNVGSAIRALFDAFSIEAENLYMLTLENISEGIESGLMQSFDFIPRDATYAYGDITIEFNNTLTANAIIPAGSSFSTGIAGSALRFSTRDSYIVQSGSNKATVTVYANTPGVVGNVESFQINTSESNVYNVTRVYNPESFLTGKDAETYEETKRRFQLFIESIGRATKNAIRYGALTVEEVHSVYVYEQVGLVTVYVADANGNLSDNLRLAVETALEDYRPAGIELVVEPMTKLIMDVTVNVKFSNNNIVTNESLSALTSVIKNFLNSLEASEDLVVTQLIKTVINADDNILDISVTEPNENVLTEPNEIIRAGQITVNVEGV